MQQTFRIENILNTNDVFTLYVCIIREVKLSIQKAQTVTERLTIFFSFNAGEIHLNKLQSLLENRY
jgi:hypothetical protein